MKKLTSQNFKITNGTSFSDILLTVTLERLVELLGQPSFVGSGDNKVQLEWVFYENENKVLIVYDYKENRHIAEIREWRVGSKGLSSDEIQKFFSKKGFNPFEYWDEKHDEKK